MNNTTSQDTSIERLLSLHSDRSVVLVQGLGYVGAVMSLVVANAISGQYAVIAVDRDDESGRKKVGLFNGGHFPLVANDPKIEEYFTNARERGNLCATVDRAAYELADVIIVDINLDVNKQINSDNNMAGYDIDLAPFASAIETIGAHCKPDVLILIETTVPPGTCRMVVEPIIQRKLSERGLPGEAVKIGHSYERVMPGPEYVDSIQNFYRVYSGVDEASADAVEGFLKTIVRTDEYPLTRLGETTATEIAKVLENSYRAMNIAFVTEWTSLAEESGVNLFEIVQAIRMRPTHANLMYPGIGVGGYCLTKDPLMASWSRKKMIGGQEGLDQSERAVTINDQMPKYAFEFLQRRHHQSLEGQTVLLLGASYRGDVGDTRFSPVESFYRYLASAGTTIRVHDPFVAEWPEIGLRPESSFTAATTPPPDIVVISAGHSIYREESTISLLCAMTPLWIYDTVGLLAAPDIARLGEQHSVIVLGRGDL